MKFLFPERIYNELTIHIGVLYTFEQVKFNHIQVTEI